MQNYNNFNPQCKPYPTFQNNMQTVGMTAQQQHVPQDIGIFVKEITDRVTNAVNYQLSVLHQAYDMISYKDSVIMDLQNKLNKSLKPDILRVHFITEDKSNKQLIYNAFKNDGSPGSNILFANFTVTYVYLYKFDKLYKKEDCLLIRFSNGKEVLIKFSELEARKIVDAMNKKGISFLLNKRDDVVGRLFLQYLSAFFDTASMIYIPYTTGWVRNGENKFTYCICKSDCCNIDSPYYKNRLMSFENVDIGYSIKECIRLYREYFIDEHTRVIMVAALIYSVLFSIYKNEFNYKIDKVLILNSTDYSSNILRKTVDMFMNLFNTRGYSYLEQSKKSFDNCILNNKDCPLILLCNKNESKYYNKSGINNIREYFINNASIEIRGNKYEAKAFLVCVGGELELILPDNEYMSLDISHDTVNLECIDNFNNCKGYWTGMIKGFISYIENNTNSINPAVVKVPDTIYYDNYDTYKLLVKSMDLLNNFTFQCGIDLSKELGITKSYADIVEDYLSREPEDEKGVIKSFLDTLEELVAENILHEKYNNTFSENEDKKNIYIIGEEVWIRHQIIQYNIVPRMNTSLKARQILTYLKNTDMLVLNKGTFECRRTVKNHFKSQESFVILKKEYYTLKNTSCISVDSNQVAVNEICLWGDNPFSDTSIKEEDLI
ncbi:MAG: hypothetical protein ACI4VF_00835 [Lachnospirales bacterium]